MPGRELGPRPQECPPLRPIGHPGSHPAARLCGHAPSPHLAWGPPQASGPAATELPRRGGKLAAWPPAPSVLDQAGRHRARRVCGVGQQVAPKLQPRPLPPGRRARPGGRTAETLTGPSRPTGCRSGWWCPGRDGGVRPPTRPRAPPEAVSTQGPGAPPGALPPLLPRDGVCRGETEAQSREGAGSAPSPLPGLGAPVPSLRGAGQQRPIPLNTKWPLGGSGAQTGLGKHPCPTGCGVITGGLPPDEGGARHREAGHGPAPDDAARPG